MNHKHVFSSFNIGSDHHVVLDPTTHSIYLAPGDWKGHNSSDSKGCVHDESSVDLPHACANWDTLMLPNGGGRVQCIDNTHD